MSDTNELVERLRPLDLSNLLQHAFRSGFEIAGGSADAFSQWWPEYDPEECAAYPRVVAALAPLEAVPVVKPLEWLGDGIWLKAYAPFGGIYRITEYSGMAKPFKLEISGFVGSSGHFELADEAKAAAQADFERRVLSALVHPPAQAGAVTEAMVEAAEEAVYGRHERGFINRPLIGAIDMRKALTAALGAQTPPEGEEPDVKLTMLADGRFYDEYGGEWELTQEAFDKRTQNCNCQSCVDRRTAALGAQTPPEGAVTEAQGWRTMESAPKDGTIIEAVGRYPEATAGFPRFVGWREDLGGGWHEHSRHAPEKIICWAWRPRAEWPAEPPVNQSEGADRG